MNIVPRSMIGVACAICLSLGATLAQAEPSYVAKVAKGAGDENAAENLAFVRLSQLVFERTNGDVEIIPLFGTQFGSEPERLENVRLGALQGSINTAAGVGSLVPQALVYNLPFIFRDGDHALKVTSGEVGRQVAGYYEDLGLHVAAFWNGGSRNPVGTFAIDGPEDIVGKKIRVKENQLAIDMWEALGANPTPMAWGEVQNALLTKTIDGYDTLGSAYFGLKLYETAPHYTHLPMSNVVYAVIFSKEWWDTLPAEYQDIIDNAARELAPMQHHLLALNNVRGPAQAEQFGATVHRVSDMTPYIDMMSDIWVDWAAGTEGGQELIDAIVATK